MKLVYDGALRRLRLTPWDNAQDMKKVNAFRHFISPTIVFAGGSEGILSLLVFVRTRTWSRGCDGVKSAMRTGTR